ncbi:MAG: hypothetical protein OYG31_00520 [Candidatus Kaiserbacteria bacterium]|nr:hypothetical protein [Candidatus Kaiserbacteria bacterium]
MEVTVTLLTTVIEHIIVSVLLGSSTVAVLLYAVNLRYKRRWDEGASAVTKLFYTVIRLFHIFAIIFVALSLLISGVLDGVMEANVEYGIKALILAINAVVAYGMHKKQFPVVYAAPVTVAGWYFFAGYHIYASYIPPVTVVEPILWYVATVALMQAVFVMLRSSVRPLPE